MRASLPLWLVAALALAGARSICPAQGLSQRGYLENTLIAYPQTAPGDSGRIVGETLLSYEPAYKLNSSFSVHGSFDARLDSHHEVQRSFDFSWWDRTPKRPVLAVRRLSAIFARGPVTLEIGKQFIRWGKTDILNPTDRFAPRDYLRVVDSDFLGVTAARLTLARQSDSLDLVFNPRFTPSRMPLLNQRWVVIPAAARNLALRDAGSRYPGGPQFGARWNHVGSRLEYSLSFFEGFNHLPLIEVTAVSPPGYVDIVRNYAKIRTYGGDIAAPLPWFTVKAEAAWFQSEASRADEYLLYVVQVERQWGEWLFIGGYGGEKVTSRRNPFDFAPDRGLARALVGRASLQIDTNRSLVFEAFVRQNGKGVFGRFEYSHGWGQHWRMTTRLAVIQGSEDDFLGQYRKNSFASLALRYSF